MNTQRPARTLADYLVTAASPVLIIVMVHSICFFLADVFYRGAAIGGVRWVLFWFVLAVVLIARVGLEQGDGHALLYGLALAAVTWLYLARIQPNVLFGALLLAIVWFTAHKLTSNCTLIDEDSDASGQGLLHAVFRLRRKFKRAQSPGAEKETSATPRVSSAPAAAMGRTKRAQSQVPGVWLVYLSLAALPVFGLGQMLLPADDAATRHRGFVYLFLYLAAALGLLVTTSFLGLRRYLRQRYLLMPGNIAMGWVKFGAVGAALVLGLTLFLPRPGVGESWGSLRYQVDYQLRRASEFAARFNPPGTGSRRAGNQSAPNSQPSQPGEATGRNGNQSEGASDANEQRSGGASQQDASSGQTGGGRPRKAGPGSTTVPNTLYRWLKTLVWLAGAILAACLLFRHRVAIGMALRSAWAAIRKFITELLGGFRLRPQAPSQTSTRVAVPPFKTFKNPFLSGGDRVWPPEKLIIYSYEALQSWVREPEFQKGSPQTPREFCRQLSDEMPEATEALDHLAYLYSHVVYAASLPGQYQPEYLRLLWDSMSYPRSARSGPREPAPIHN